MSRSTLARRIGAVLAKRPELDELARRALERELEDATSRWLLEFYVEPMFVQDAEVMGDAQGWRGGGS